MKKTLSFICTLLLWNALVGQILNQDASGNSSILLSGGSIGLDVKESLIKANYYSSTDQVEGAFWGVDFQGKNSTGISDLFSKERFTPQSSISGVIGYHKASINYNGEFDDKIEISKEISELEQSREELILMIDTIQYIKAAADEIEKLGGNDIASEIRKILSKPTYLTYQESIGSLPYKITKDERTDEIVKKVKELNTRVQSDPNFKEYKSLDKKLTSLRQRIKKIENDPNNSTSKNKGYLRAGVNTTEFKLDLMNSSSVFEDRFQDTLEAFWFIELGYTGRWRQNLLGASFVHRGVSSFSNLKKSTYTLESTEANLTDGDLKKKTEVVAFNGNYFKTTQSTIRIDFLHLFLWNQKESKFLAVGGYIDRSFFGKGNALEFLSDRSLLGFSINLIDGKKGQYNAGLYLQTSDLFNEADIGLTKAISFGLTTKYVLGNPLRPQAIEEVND